MMQLTVCLSLSVVLQLSAVLYFFLLNLANSRLCVSNQVSPLTNSQCVCVCLCLCLSYDVLYSSSQYVGGGGGGKDNKSRKHLFYSKVSPNTSLAKNLTMKENSGQVEGAFLLQQH